MLCYAASFYVQKRSPVWRKISGCPNQPNQPILPRWLKTHLAFSMFPILDTNLWGQVWGAIWDDVWVDVWGFALGDVLCNAWVNIWVDGWVDVFVDVWVDVLGDLWGNFWRSSIDLKHLETLNFYLTTTTALLFSSCMHSS